MALKLMAGFDLYPGAADASKFPVQGQGISNTHYANLFLEQRTPNTTNTYGVTGLPEHKLGAGSAIERNALVFRRSGSQNTALFMRTKDVFKVAAASEIIACAFTFKILPGVNLAGNAVQILTLYTSGDVAIAGGGFLRVQATSDANIQLVWLGGVIPLTTFPYLTAGREYHFEVRLYRRPVDQVGYMSADFYIDGERIMSSPAFASGTLFDTTGMKFAFGNALMNANLTYTFLYGDIIISEPGGDLFPAGIGPQLVLPAKVGSVTPGNWEKEGNATPAETLNDGDDATYFASPTDAGTMSAKIVAPLVSYQARATEVVIRASRDRDAGRTLSAELLGNSGNSLTPTQNIATANGYNNYLLTRIQSGAEADLRTPTVRLSATVP